MTHFHAILLGIIEGITEFLPISSTAHIDIARYTLSIPSSSFIKSFEIIIQLGAIGAVIVLYARKVLSSWQYMKNLLIAFIPTGIIGFLLYKLIKTLLLGNLMVEALALLIGGILIVWFERRQEKHLLPPTQMQIAETLSVRDLILLGCAQALAVIPGVSRSGAVIVAGRALGLQAKLITEFSFLLAVPTMLAAVAYDIYKSGFAFSSGQWGTIIIGFTVSFIVALGVIKWLLEYIRTHSFKAFGWYRIILGIALVLGILFNLL